MAAALGPLPDGFGAGEKTGRDIHSRESAMNRCDPDEEIAIDVMADRFSPGHRCGLLSRDPIECCIVANV